MNNNKIKVSDASGNEKEYDLIGYVRLDSGNYIVYTNNEELSDGRIKMYVNCLIEEENGTVFDEVTDEELKQVISKLQERLV